MSSFYIYMHRNNFEPSRSAHSLGCWCRGLFLCVPEIVEGCFAIFFRSFFAFLECVSALAELARGVSLYLSVSCIQSFLSISLFLVLSRSISLNFYDLFADFLQCEVCLLLTSGPDEVMTNYQLQGFCC